MSSGLVFRSENFRNVQPELPELLRRHWAEVALDHDEVPLDPDYLRYYALQDAGSLSTITARVGPGGPLVGYHIMIVSGHLHYRDTLHGVTDVYYLTPEQRKGFNGVRLFKAVDVEAKLLGVKKRVTATKDHMNMGRLLERLGYRLTEHTYTKILEG